MLVLSRRPGESMVIGDDVVVRVLDVRGDQVRIGIDAPRHVRIDREEVIKDIEVENTSAAGAAQRTREMVAKRPPRPQGEAATRSTPPFRPPPRG